MCNSMDFAFFDIFFGFDTSKARGNNLKFDPKNCKIHGKFVEYFQPPTIWPWSQLVPVL